MIKNDTGLRFSWLDYGITTSGLGAVAHIRNPIYIVGTHLRNGGTCCDEGSIGR